MLRFCPAVQRHTDARNCAARRARSAARRAATDPASSLTLCEVLGFTCTPTGFVALVGPAGTVLPRARTAVEVLRDAPVEADERVSPDARVLALPVTATHFDASAPSSPKALTLLLLSQRPICDLAPAEFFPPETLAGLFVSEGEEEEVEESNAEPPSLLAAMVITEVGTDYVSAQAFAEGALERTPIVDDAWLALALALRYAPFGARLFVTAECLREGGRHSLRAADARRIYPLLVTAEEVRQQGNAAFDALRRAFPTKD